LLGDIPRAPQSHPAQAHLLFQFGTSYNVASGVTQVNLGSSDSDTFTYDPNTDRMTEYEFTVNSQSVTGILTWNSIGTLASLAVTDPFNSGDAQTCSYSHDDETRIASANCGSVWSQTFTYDAFGNINKSGSSSFGATYSTSTNRMTLIGSSTPTYDANGNVTNDFLNTYAWDSNNRPVTADSVGLTYDALGRMVEQSRSGAYTQIVYSPSGAKLALMTGSSLQKGFIPLTGGSMAVYNSSGLAYYRHSDWIGSSRFSSTPSRTMYSDGAYAPFGEPYAQTGTADLSFTGVNQDTASNMYDFPAREYGTQGRWPSPDPAGISSVSLKNPQTWNRYAYVGNNPLTVTDPTGMLAQNTNAPVKNPNMVGTADDTEELQALSNMQAAAQAAEDDSGGDDPSGGRSSSGGDNCVYVLLNPCGTSAGGSSGSDVAGEDCASECDNPSVPAYASLVLSFCASAEACAATPPVNLGDVATLLSNMDTNIAETSALMVAADACAALGFGGCPTTTAVAMMALGPYVPTSGYAPPDAHVPEPLPGSNSYPTGTYPNEPAPYVGPPVGGEGP
jgi:RHS repeat-associated protein